MTHPPTHPPTSPRDYDRNDIAPPDVRLQRFLDAARDQVGDKYRFGTETSESDANPTAFDSSELVEWAAHRAGVHDMPDGSWNQYRYLHEKGASVPVEEALRTPGALVFGFSSDPLASPGRPARAYVGISLGNGKVLDVSERAGEVREMDPGNFYGYGAKVPGLHFERDDVLILDSRTTEPGPFEHIHPDGKPPGGVIDGPHYYPVVPGPRSHQDPQPNRGHERPGLVCEPDDDPVVPTPRDGPNGRVLHEPLPPRPGTPRPGLVDEPDPPEPNVCYPEEPLAEEPVSYPNDLTGLSSPAEPAPALATADAPTYADASDVGPGTPTYADASAVDLASAGYGTSTYVDPQPDVPVGPYADPYADLSAEV
jgi:hypothetical protein